MKVTKIFISILLLFLSFSIAAETRAVVQSFSGKVEIQTSGREWSTVTVGQVIPTGSTISTGFRSEAVLEVGTAVLEVKPLTRMRLDELIEREGTVKTDLYLRVGRVKANVSRTSGLQNDFRLRSPVSTAAVRGTSFTYDGMNLDVAEGLVALINSYGQASGIPAGVSVSSNGIDIPPGSLDAINAMFGVNISTAQIDEIVDAFDQAGLLQSSSVSVVWTSGGLW